jgi:hypothetical protein
VLWLASTSVGSLLGSFQLGPATLGWTPADQASFSQFSTPLRVCLQRGFTMPFLRQHGTKSVWFQATAVAALGYSLLGQTHRLLGPAARSLEAVGMRVKTAHMLQYMLVKLVLVDVFVGLSSISFNAMFLKHALYKLFTCALVSGRGGCRLTES